MGSGALNGTYNHLPQVLRSTGQGGPSASQLIPGTQNSELRAGVWTGDTALHPTYFGQKCILLVGGGFQTSGGGWAWLMKTSDLQYPWKQGSAHVCEDMCEKCVTISN